MTINCPLCQRGNYCPTNDQLQRRSTVISEPGAAMRVEEFKLTDEEREGLTINVDLGKVDFVK